MILSLKLRYKYTMFPPLCSGSNSDGDLPVEALHPACRIKQEKTARKKRGYKKPAAKAAARHPGKLNSTSAAPEILRNDT